MRDVFRRINDHILLALIKRLLSHGHCLVICELVQRGIGLDPYPIVMVLRITPGKQKLIKLMFYSV